MKSRITLIFHIFLFIILPYNNAQAMGEVCSRHYRIVEAIEAQVNKKCKDITLNDLASVKWLSISYFCHTGDNPSVIDSSSFQGLINLEGIVIGTCGQSLSKLDLSELNVNLRKIKGPAIGRLVLSPQIQTSIVSIELSGVGSIHWTTAPQLEKLEIYKGYSRFESNPWLGSDFKQNFPSLKNLRIGLDIDNLRQNRYQLDLPNLNELNLELKVDNEASSTAPPVFLDLGGKAQKSYIKCQPSSPDSSVGQVITAKRFQSDIVEMDGCDNLPEIDTPNLSLKNIPRTARWIADKLTLEKVENLSLEFAPFARLKFFKSSFPNLKNFKINVLLPKDGGRDFNIDFQDSIFPELRELEINIATKIKDDSLLTVNGSFNFGSNFFKQAPNLASISICEMYSRWDLSKPSFKYLMEAAQQGIKVLGETKCHE